MFAPKGWISLREIYFTITAIFDEKGHIGDIEIFGDENFEVTWLYLQESSEVAVCLPSGEPVSASRLLIFSDNPYDNLNDHIDISVGTVGSSQSSNHMSEPPDERELQRRYGPFLHLPLIFPHDDFLEFLDDFEADIPAYIGPRLSTTDETDPLPIGENQLFSKRDMSPRAVSEEIIRLADLGKLPKFQDAKALLAKEQSVRSFRFAWNLAREKRPEISRPGRKPKGPNS